MSELDFHQDRSLELLRQRDHRAQEHLWKTQRRRLLAVATSILASQTEAEALVGDVLCDFMFNYVDNLQHGRAIGAYLRIMTVRRARRKSEFNKKHDMLDEHIVGNTRDSESSDRVERNIWMSWLHLCLEKLSPKARMVVKLHFGNELSYQKVAEVVGRTKQAVGKMVLKSLEVLKKCLERKRSESKK